MGKDGPSHKSVICKSIGEEKCMAPVGNVMWLTKGVARTGAHSGG